MKFVIRSGLILMLLLSTACQISSRNDPENPGRLSVRVLAVESFLADIAQQVAGDRIEIEYLIPRGLDPHTYEPTPGDLARIIDSDVLILNGGGLEEVLENILGNSGSQSQIIIASSGLESRADDRPEPGTLLLEEHDADPHYWLDPINVIRYVENIRTGLIQADPEGESDYTENAEAYIQELNALNTWIIEQVSEIPIEERLLVTNHESFGYFADRYGFQIIGAIIPSVSSGASPSALDLAQLIDRIRSSGAKAIFLETGSQPKLAEQIASETGIKIVYGLYTHSPTGPDGVAPSYIALMNYNVQKIVEALK